MAIEGIIGGGDQPAVRGNMTPPRNAVATGEIVNGKYVLREARRRWGRQVQRDPDGNILYHMRADGSRRAPAWELVELEPEWIEYVIEDNGNGMTKRNEYFRPSKDELERKDRLARREQALDGLITALEVNNLDVNDLIMAIRGLQEVPLPPSEVIPVDPVENPGTEVLDRTSPPPVTTPVVAGTTKPKGNKGDAAAARP